MSLQNAELDSIMPCRGLIPSSFLIHTFTKKISKTVYPRADINVISDAVQIQDTMLCLVLYVITKLVTL